VSLYAEVTRLHGDLPWGRVLDAGTGPASLRWLLDLPTSSWTAVTASQPMAERMRQLADGRMRADDRLVVGNWVDSALLAGERFDTVLADYLLGAIDGFAPYWQDQLFARLAPHVAGRLYVIGLEPYVPFQAEDEDGALVVRIGRLRDACLLLANDRPYREYPLDWCLRQMENARLRVLDVRRRPIRYGERFINSQLDMCSRAIDRLADRRLAVAMHGHVATLRTEALAAATRSGGLRHGYDYVIVAEPAR
jgi:hypothetical protein